MFSNFFLAPLLKDKYKEKQERDLLEDYDQNNIRSKYPEIFNSFTVSNFKLISNYSLLYESNIIIFYLKFVITRK